MKKRIFLIALLLSVIAISASALAASDTRQLNAAFNDIKVYIEGELISPKDALGRPVEPFIVDGTTYLPLRAVAEALGKNVEWDGPNQSVYVGKKPVISTPTPLNPATAKIVIITTDVTQNEEEYRSAQEMEKKYGEDRIIHKIWPVKFTEEGEQMIRLVQKIAADPEVKALIINQCVQNSLAAVQKLLETRDDIFLVAIQPTENPPDIAKCFNLILYADEIMMGDAMPLQAIKMGAKTFVHLSFPRNMYNALILARYGMLKENCEKLGMEFVTYTVPDPIGDIGMVGAQQVMLEEIPKIVAQYGKDTAFFTTNCDLQAPLIKAVVETGAIYPQPCCPSPFHGFPLALGLVSGTFGVVDDRVDEQSVFEALGTEDTSVTSSLKFRI